MKRKVIGSLAVIAIVALAAFNINFNNQDVQLSSISLANVEAFAQGEVIIGTLSAQVCFNCWCNYPDGYYALGQFQH